MVIGGTWLAIFFVICVWIKERYVWMIIDAFAKAPKEGFFEGFSRGTAICLKILSAFTAFGISLTSVLGIIWMTEGGF